MRAQSAKMSQAGTPACFTLLPAEHAAGQKGLDPHQLCARPWHGARRRADARARARAQAMGIQRCVFSSIHNAYRHAGAPVMQT